MIESIPGYDNWKLMSPEDEAHSQGRNCGMYGCCGNPEYDEEEIEEECPHCDEDPCTGKNIEIARSLDHAYECNKADVFEPECKEDGPFNVIFHEDRECDCHAQPTVTYLTPNSKRFTRHSEWHVSTGSFYVCSCGFKDPCGDEDWETHVCTPPPRCPNGCTISPGGCSTTEHYDDIPF